MKIKGDLQNEHKTNNTHGPAFEDFRGYLAVPYDQSINFSVRQIN